MRSVRNPGEVGEVVVEEVAEGDRERALYGFRSLESVGTSILPVPFGLTEITELK